MLRSSIMVANMRKTPPTPTHFSLLLHHLFTEISVASNVVSFFPKCNFLGGSNSYLLPCLWLNTCDFTIAVHSVLRWRWCPGGLFLASHQLELDETNLLHISAPSDSLGSLALSAHLWAEFSLKLPSSHETADLYGQRLLLCRKHCLRDANSKSRCTVERGFQNEQVFQFCFLCPSTTWAFNALPSPQEIKSRLNQRDVSWEMSMRHCWKVNSFCGGFCNLVISIHMQVPFSRREVFFFVCLFQCSKLSLLCLREGSFSLV